MYGNTRHYGGHVAQAERRKERRTIGERERNRERERARGWGGRKARRGHDDRGRIMTIITIYMQVPSLPAHEQSTHSISYLIWIIQTNLSFLPSFLCTLYNPNKRDETSTASRFFSTGDDDSDDDSSGTLILPVRPVRIGRRQTVSLPLLIHPLSHSFFLSS